MSTQMRHLEPQKKLALSDSISWLNGIYCCCNWRLKICYKITIEYYQKNNIKSNEEIVLQLQVLTFILTRICTLNLFICIYHWWISQLNVNSRLSNSSLHSAAHPADVPFKHPPIICLAPSPGTEIFPMHTNVFLENALLVVSRECAVLVCSALDETS